MPPKTKGELGLVENSRTIQSDPIVRIDPEVNFTIAPVSIPWAELPGYPYGANQPVAGAPAQPPVYLTPGQSEITFTASVRVPEGDFIIAYEWDFGDGSKGYGQSVAHTYVAASPSTRAVLCVTDNHGRRFCRGKQVNLRKADLTLISPAISMDHA
jgi:PKD repeat protein